LGAIAFFLGERFPIPRIPTFTEQFCTISRKWTLAQTLTTTLFLTLTLTDPRYPKTLSGENTIAPIVVDLMNMGTCKSWIVDV